MGRVRDTELENILRGRPKVSGITIDGDHARNHDDAFMITARDDGTTLVEVSIADTPAFVKIKSPMDLFAQRITRDIFHVNKKIASMLPLALTRKKISLNENEHRAAVTFTIELDKDMAVTDVKIQRTAFVNKQRVTMSEVDESVHHGSAQALQWLAVARKLFARRQQEMMAACAYNIPDAVSCVIPDSSVDVSRKAPGDFLVHEIMILTNRVATDYMRKNKLPFAQCFEEPKVWQGAKSGSHAFANKAAQIRDSIQKKINQIAARMTITSPTREYTDLMNMRILVAHLEGRPLPHSAEELQKIRKARIDIKAAFGEVGPYCSVEQASRMLHAFLSGDFHAVAHAQRKTLDGVRDDSEAAYYARLGQGRRQSDSKLPCTRMLTALEDHVGGRRGIQASIGSVMV